MKAMFKYEGQDPAKDSREEDLTPAQVQYLQRLEERGIKEFVIPHDKVIVTIEKSEDGQYLLTGRDIEVR